MVGRIMSELEKFAICAELEKLVCEEADARRSYYILLTKFSPLLEEEDRNSFNLIISEELKHSELISAIVERISKISAEE